MAYLCDYEVVGGHLNNERVLRNNQMLWKKGIEILDIFFYSSFH